MNELQAGERALLRFLRQREALSAQDVAHLTELAGTSQLRVLELTEREGVIGAKVLAALLADALRLRLVDLASAPLDQDPAQALSDGVAIMYEVVPVRVEGGLLQLATANPLDVDALKAVEFATGRRVRFVVTTRAQILWGLGRAYRGTQAPEAPESPEVPEA